MVIIAVLGALGIIYIMVLQMSADVVFTSNYYQKILFKEKAYYISRSTFSGINKLLSLEDDSFDSLKDEWAREIMPIPISGDNVDLLVKIEDQERYFNLNSIVKEGKEIDSKHEKQFRRLLEILRIDPNLSNAVIDWIDKDQEPRIPLGAEGLDYPDISAKGGNLDSLEELKLVRGFDDIEIFQGKVSNDGKAVPGLKDLLTVHSDGKININTARSEILLSLDDYMTEELVTELIRRRNSKPFKTMDELIELPGMNSDLLYRIKALSDVKSKYFKITFTVTSKDKRLRESSDLTVVVKRAGSSGKIVYWQAN